MINAISLYRIAQWAWNRKIPLLPDIIKLIIFVIYNSSISYQCKIGKGSILAYGGIGVIIHKKCIIGNNVVIGSQVTIGGRSGSKGVPKIGNNVFIGTGAKLLGDITVGESVVIGANSVVIESVPSFTVVAYVPSKVIRDNFTMDEYNRIT